ncbi:ABC-type bacteriocin/lantibiotic exporter, contains an N-terminal double-glycine peptidase domain [Cohaesibacter sp. ES.047]|uniref:ATP-binding cassette domain-containing protein n=1 Tax=Cohaesibacter sp. ES.047 TaxID=1798205 RepID=UPI000BB81C4B|nr:ATP-binding cassette domain-containing protein [Cohaesibacter sp. ES.047]SNY92244.1 ABC-type bacteriocin/lantibiotic exporter, contains an N-terminal double-glycine peptidase domain [Cohaesibacter sp. ES.047]
MTELAHETEFQTSAHRISRFLQWHTPEMSMPRDPLIEALQHLAKGCDAKLPPSAKLMGSESRDRSIHRLSREAGVHARMVQLKDQTIGESPIPLLAFRKTEDALSEPVLLHRSGKNWSVSDMAKDWKKQSLKRLDLRSFEETAYMILPSLPDGQISKKALLMFGLGRSKRELMAFGLMTLLSGLAITLIPMASAPLLDYVVPEGDRGLTYNIAIFFAIVLGVNMLTRFASGIAQLRIKGINGFLLRAAAIDRAIRLADKKSELGQSIPSAPIAVLSTRSIESWHRGVWGIALSVLSSILIALPSIFVIATTSLAGGLAFAGILAIVLAVGYVISKRRIMALIDGLSTPQSWMTHAYEGLSMVDTIRSTAAEGRLFNNWTDAFLALRHRFLKSDRAGVSSTAMEGSVDGLLVLSAIIALAITGGVTSGSAPVSLVIAAGNVAGAIVALLSALSQAPMLGIQYRMIEMLLKDTPNPANTGLIPPDLSGEISCRTITCRHGNSARPAIEQVSFDIKAGEHIGITGPSGAGKSTLIKAILGLIPCESGSVRFEGLELSSLDQQAIRQQIGIVDQNGKLFPGTLFENIAAGAPISSQQAMQAVAMAGLQQDVEALPLGLNTPVGETECGFSGGQVQRFLLARAFVNKPKILIFDEATSALDPDLQDHIDWAIDQMDATVISIAHRLETLQTCHRILVLDQGVLVEQGSYHELVEAGGLFSTLIDAGEDHQPLQA